MQARSTAVVVLLVLAAACSRGGTPPADVAGSPDGTAEPDRVERLTVAVSGDHGPLNLFAQHEEPLTELVYDKLLAPSPYVDDPQPWLAAGVEQLDPATWEVTLRDDVTWHDGEPFTAADVAFTVALFKRAPAGRWTHHVTDVPHVDEVEVLDATTVRYHCGYPCPFLGSVTLADLPVVPQHIWEDVEEPREISDLPVGTGPYRLVDYDPDSGYRFEANEDYFAGEPLVGELVMPIIENPSTAFTALRTGEVDAVSRLVPPELVDRFRAEPDIAVAETSPLVFPVLQVNYERPPFDDQRFRAALSGAVDREQLLEIVWLGQGRPATRGYLHPDTPWAAPDVETTYRPDEAARLLTAAGYEDSDGDGVRELDDGTPIRLSIKVAGTEPTWVRAAELLVEQLVAVGLDARVETLDPGAVSDLFSSRDFDTYISEAPTHGVADPTQFIMSHFSGYLWNLPDVPYPEMAALIEQWKAAETIAARTEKLHEMQRLFDAQPTHIPLYYPDGPIAYRPDAYDGWAESPGYGLVHKWSLLPREVARGAQAIVESTDQDED